MISFLLGPALGSGIAQADTLQRDYAPSRVSKAAGTVTGSPQIGRASEPQAAADLRLAEQDVGSFARLTSAELATKLSRKNFLFVNVHVPYEGEIEGTDLFIPYDNIADELDQLPADRNAKIVLYCQSGRMSEIAARALVRLGFTQVSDLAGGMNAWRASGRELIEE